MPRNGPQPRIGKAQSVSRCESPQRRRSTSIDAEGVAAIGVNEL